MWGGPTIATQASAPLSNSASQLPAAVQMHLRGSYSSAMKKFNSSGTSACADRHQRVRWDGSLAILCLVGLLVKGARDGMRMLAHGQLSPTTMSFVSHGESSKLLAPPRNTKDRKHLQSIQTTVNRHNSQTKHQALSKGQPRSQDA